MQGKKGAAMIKVGSYRILHESEFRKFEKLHRIFREYSEDELDLIISGRVHLHLNPKRKKREAA